MTSRKMVPMIGWALAVYAVSSVVALLAKGSGGSEYLTFAICLGLGAFLIYLAYHKTDAN